MQRRLKIDGEFLQPRHSGRGVEGLTIELRERYKRFKRNGRGFRHGEGKENYEEEIERA